MYKLGYQPVSNVQAEAPAIFQPAEGQFNIIASHLTGWAANPPQMFVSEGKSLCKERSKLHSVDAPAHGPGFETTFNSQVKRFSSFPVLQYL